MKYLRYLFILVIALGSNAVFAKCVQRSSVCVDGPSTKQINGVNVYKSCWQYTDSYECQSSSAISNCQALKDKGCGQIGSDCIERDASGVCIASAQKYSCPDKPAASEEKTVCDTSFCQDGGTGCFDTSRTPDADFGQAAAMTEVTRQAGVYGVDPSKIEIFKGYSSECTVKVLGGSTIKSCCEGSGGGAGYTNHAVLSAGLGAAGGVVGGVGRSAIKTGSTYVYDALYQQTNSGLMDKGLSAMNNWASDMSSSSSFGAYGFTFTYSIEGGFAFTGFDPYSFAASVAIQMVMEWLSCTPDEQTYALKKGQNLCVYVRSYCSNKIPIIDVCIEQKEVNCCFNSILAKIVNRQGRVQLGLPSNQCGGFNQAQIKAINFAAIDFSEFIATITSTTPNKANMTNQVNSTVQQKVQSYYDQ